MRNARDPRLVWSNNPNRFELAYYTLTVVFTEYAL